MAANIQELSREGKLTQHQELLTEVPAQHAGVAEDPGPRPENHRAAVERLPGQRSRRRRKARPRRQAARTAALSEKSEQKILKAIEDYRRISGRFLLDEADRTAEKLTEHLKHIKGIDKITPAGSLRRGRETVGDLDVLITGPCCVDDAQRAALIEEILRFPGIVDVLAKGDNKVSFKLRSGMQVDVRTLPPESYGAAMQYFTGSKNHNVTLRQRALKMGSR